MHMEVRNATARHHEDLRVWKAALRLAKDVYRFTAKLPAVERYGLAAQLRTASTSIAANLAEGAARGSPRDFARIVSIAQGSVAEVDTYLRLVEELYGIPREASITAELTSIRSMLIRLRAALIARS
jgi:four helix bundle protein